MKLKFTPPKTKSTKSSLLPRVLLLLVIINLSTQISLQGHFEAEGFIFTIAYINGILLSEFSNQLILRKFDLNNLLTSKNETFSSVIELEGLNWYTSIVPLLDLKSMAVGGGHDKIYILKVDDGAEKPRMVATHHLMTIGEENDNRDVFVMKYDEQTGHLLASCNNMYLTIIDLKLGV